MRKSNILILFVVVLIVITLTLSLVTPFWPFTGRAVDESSCKESDSGEDAFTAGITVSAKREGRDTCNVDKNKLREYYCENGKVKKTKPITCRWGCDSSPVSLDGQDLGVAWKCKPRPSFCEDNDQKDSSKKGVTKDIKGKYEDTCSEDKSSVVEYICDANNESSKSEIPCQYGCDNGKCRGEPKLNCEDTDISDDPKTPGIVRTANKEGQSDFFVDTCEGNKIKEFACQLESGKQVPKLVTCEGKCETKTIFAFGKDYLSSYCDPKPLSCTDTDTEASNPNEIKGTVTASDIKGIQTSAADTCISTNELNENSCDNNIIKTETKKCSDICTDGACTVRDSKCADSDGGKDYSVRGEVTTQFGSVTDFCADANLLAEFGCKEGKKLVSGSKTSTKIAVIYKKCTNGCSNGACIGQSNEDTQEVIA